MKRCYLHLFGCAALSLLSILHAAEPLGPSTRRSGLVFSEIMFRPGAQASGKTVEFVELFNAQAEFEDLSGYRLTGAVDFTFPAGTIFPTGAFLVVSKAPDDIRATYGITNVLGPYSGTLSQSSGTLRLRHRSGAILVEASYSSEPPWPVAADRTGHSLVLARASLGGSNPRAWAASTKVGGSPGQPEPTEAEPLADVVVNEILAHPAPGQAGFVELYNHGLHAVDLSGAWLTDDAAQPKFQIPPGTALAQNGFVAFDAAQLGFAPAPGGGTIYLWNSARTRVIDAVRFGAQSESLSWGRSGNGAETWRALAHPTPGGSNADVLIPSVVINEIMFAPISGSSDDEYVELFNRGAKEVSVAGWKFTAGIDFTFPTGVSIPAGGYLVIAKNLTHLQTSYSNLTSANAIGNYKGTLANRGQRLALAMPDPVGTTDASGAKVITFNDVVVNEVTYGAGGRWGQWSDGGGSSLELIDPRSDNQLAGNWGQSDESAKAPWTDVTATGVLDNGTGSADELQLFIQGPGECLVDNVQVISSSGANLVPNSDFEGDATGWVAEGTQENSSLEPFEGYQSQHSFHLRAVARGDDEVNRVRIRLSSPVPVNQTATIRAKVRWLRGFPTLLFRLRGNYLEAIGRMTIPSNLGTPGAPNSVAAANTGPAIYDVTHAPVLPADGAPVTVTARVHDPDGISAVFLKYRIDPAPDVSSVPMVDDGTGGDTVAGDGIYSATIPGQPSGTLVAFSIHAIDAAAVPASATFPSDAPARECLVKIGEVQPAGSFGTYRLWMTQATFNRWSTRSKLSNTPLDVTFAYNDYRAIYNAQALFAGSPYISPGYSTPSGALCGYTIITPADDPFLGATDIVLDWPGRDNTAIEEQLSYWIAGQIGLPYNYRRFIHLHVNGVNEQQRGSIYEDVQQPSSDSIKEWVPNDTAGDFYKIERWFEFSDGGQLLADPEPTLQNFTTTGGVKKLARYRWNWLKRADEDVNEYSNIFRLVDAVNAPAPEPYTYNTEALIDLEEWMRIFAVEHIVDNFDSYGHLIGKNMYAYKPQAGKWLLFMFDIDWVMKESAAYGHGQTTTAPLFDVNDPVIGRMYNHPPFRRAYFRGVQDAVNGPLLADRINPVMDAKYAALAANGVVRSAGRPLVPPDAVKQWIADRRAFLVQQLATVAADFRITSNGGTDFATASQVALTGTAPVAVKTITVNGLEAPVTWTSVTAWSMDYPSVPGQNRLTLQGLDARGEPVPDALASIAIEFTGSDPLLGNRAVINEWMASNTKTLPAPVGGQFEDWFELFNPNPTPVDLSSYWLTDNLTNLTEFRIPPGTIIGPGQFLLVWADSQPQENGGTDLHVPFKLAQAGEELGLFSPNGTLVDSVRFGAQLSDVSQGRWPDGAGFISLLTRPTPGAPNQIAAPGEIRILSLQGMPGGGVQFVWTAEPGKNYRVQGSTDLNTWTDLGTVPAAGSSATFSEATPQASNRFYRVVADQ